MKLEENTNRFEEDFNELLNDPNKDDHTKLELLRALSETLLNLIEDWVLLRQTINSEISNLEKQLENEKEL